MTLFNGRIQFEHFPVWWSEVPASERRSPPLFRVLMTALLVLAVLVLSGCNTSAIYQDDLYNPPVYWGSHVVKKGETLYWIA